MDYRCLKPIYFIITEDSHVSSGPGIEVLGPIFCSLHIQLLYLSMADPIRYKTWEILHSCRWYNDHSDLDVTAVYPCSSWFCLPIWVSLIEFEQSVYTHVGACENRVIDISVACTSYNFWLVQRHPLNNLLDAQEIS